MQAEELGAFSRCNGGRQRPNSLFDPEKEPFNFAVHLVGAPPEVEQLVDHIKIVAEQFLYHWKTFPLNLPPSLSGMQNGHDNRKCRQVHFRDLFVAPSFDELDAVAIDGTGEPRCLTNNQLKSLRDKGEFDVPSLNFPGQFHRWRLSEFLQKGYLRAHTSLLSDLALGTRFSIVTARGRIFGHFLSLTQAFRALLNGFLQLIDMIVGIPSLLAHNLDYKIKEERCRYLIAELVCRTEYEHYLDSLSSYVRRQLRRATAEKFDLECDAVQPVPYLFLTPKGQQIDLRLFSQDITRKALPILASILERETRGWFLHFRERLIAELREIKMTDNEIEEEVNEAVMKEYLQRVFNSILLNSDLAALGENIPQLLIQQAKSVIIMHKAVQKTKKELEKTLHNNKICLINDYPVLSKISPWLRSQLRIAETTKVNNSTWLAHEEAIKMCAKQNLEQATYFLCRDLAFMKEREPILLKELKNAKSPTRSFQWSCRIWSAKSWVIRRNFQGQSEIVPTVISEHATSIVTPRSDPSQPVYLIERETIRTTSTRWPFWRFVNFLQRVWCWTWNMMFLLGVIVPWDSALSLRSLFCIAPFASDLELSQVNGTLFPRKTSITKTLASRLIELWRHISKSRSRFESDPDTGFIGKGLTRHVNRIWNYIVKGLLGTTLIVFIFPVACIAASIGSIMLAITTPIWVPCVTVLLHLYMMFVFDIDSPESNKNKYCKILEAVIWNFIIKGLLQPAIALIVAFICCPLATVGICIVGVLRYCLRLMWDAFTFHLFIKKWGRVPSSNSLAVKRIAGPGLANNFYFVIKPEQALAALEAKMELDELHAYQNSIESIILQPQRDYSQFIEACFGPFSAKISSMGPFLLLEKEAKELIASLHEKLAKRRNELQIGLKSSIKTKIKLNAMELKIILQQGAHLLEKFYPEHVFDKLPVTDDSFWDTKGLQPGDWAGLTANLYAEIFSLDFLTPVVETDNQFKLEPDPQMDLIRYIEMVQNASEIMGINGPDLLGNVYAPRGNIQISSPYLELSAFNPRSKITANARKLEKPIYRNTLLSNPCNRFTTQSDKKILWRPWKRKPMDKYLIEKLLIPLPIPHPVQIAIAIHNRDSEQPIPLDSQICWDILRAIEDCNCDVKESNFISYSHGSRADSSLESLESTSKVSQSSNATHNSSSKEVDRRETIPCGHREVSTTITHSNDESSSFHWTLKNWSTTQNTRRRYNAGSVRVDLASPEDISLDTDSSRVVFSAYGTTV